MRFLACLTFLLSFFVLMQAKAVPGVNTKSKRDAKVLTKKIRKTVEKSISKAKYDDDDLWETLSFGTPITESVDGNDF